MMQSQPCHRCLRLLMSLASHKTSVALWTLSFSLQPHVLASHIAVMLQPHCCCLISQPQVPTSYPSICFGFVLQHFGSVGAVWVTSVVRDQELPHFREDPVPGGSKREPLLAEAGTSMQSGGIFKKDSKTLHTAYGWQDWGNVRETALQTPRSV